MIYFKALAHSLTVWLLASLINGLLFGIVFGVIMADAGSALVLLPACAASMVFSAPGAFCFCLVFCIAAGSGRGGQPLFRLLLVTAVLCGAVTGMAAGLLLHDFTRMPLLLMTAMGMTSASLSLFAHRGLLVLINNPSKPPHHV